MTRAMVNTKHGMNRNLHARYTFVVNAIELPVPFTQYPSRLTEDELFCQP
jgi:hypothetical protein